MTSTTRHNLAEGTSAGAAGRSPILLGIGVAVAALLAVLPLFVDQYTQYILNLILVYVVLGTGLNFLLGYSGQFAFANAALMGIGAYATGYLMSKLNFSFWIALPASGVIAAVLGSLSAFPAMRMKLLYLALVTLAFSELALWIFFHWKPITGGTDGLGIPPARLFGLELRGDYYVYYVNLAVTLVMLVLARWIVASPLGRAFVSIRENEIVARCNGIDVASIKLRVFAISAFYAGIGGSLYALTVGYLQPETFGVAQVVTHFSIVVVGGLSSLLGPVVGALLLTTLPELLRDFRGVQELIYGSLLAMAVMFMPGGLVGLVYAKGLLPREILVRSRKHVLKKLSERHDRRV